MHKELFLYILIAALFAVIIHQNYRTVDLMERTCGFVKPISIEKLK